MKEKPISSIVAAALSALLASAGTGALAQHDHGASHSHAHEAAPAASAKEQKPWGIEGDAKAVKRTIEVDMTDGMRFSPDRIEVRRGETVRFVVRNKGQQLHELVLGTKKELDEHAAAMVKYPKMEHDEAHMVHVSSGNAGELVWNFNRAGEFDYACLIPGHYQAGMVGKVKVK